MPDNNEGKVLHTPTMVTKLAREIASEAYIYAYPLVLMDVTRETLTNFSAPGTHGAPLNQFCNRRTFPEPADTAVISPNADTLYSFAFLDLSREPMVLSLPDMGTRYYLMQILDGWTNVFASLGTRTTGNGKADFAITGPKGAGELPSSVLQIKSPTDLAWIIGRTQTNGRADYGVVNEIQERYKLAPLSCFGKPYRPADDLPVNPNVDMKTPPAEQVMRMSAESYFARFNALLKNNPPAAGDSEAIKHFAAITVAPGRLFNLRNTDPIVAAEIEAGVQEGRIKLLAEARKLHGKTSNGWEFITTIGRYGTDYLWRAVVALVGLGASLPEDAIYPRATRDAEGQPLNGSNRYEITFAKGQLPPVGAFWSITMYNDRQLFVPNPINRYAIGDRDKIEFNSDGSLTLYVQTLSPGKDKESNWLPAPPEAFNLTMRLYWPKKEIIEGSWRPPRIEKKQSVGRKIA